MALRSLWPPHEAAQAVLAAGFELLLVAALDTQPCNGPAVVDDGVAGCFEEHRFPGPGWSADDDVLETARPLPGLGGRLGSTRG